MADILKITTPLLDRNQALQTNRQHIPQSGSEFQLMELNKVVKSNPQGELLQQNNGMPTRDGAPAILMNLLRDPSVTVNFLRNIYLLQEVLNLIPAGNEALTNEIDELFRQLMVQPQEIAGELVRQENDATMFRGELFDLLRNLVHGSDQPETRFAVANLLKSLNAALSKEDILSSVSNNLTFFADELKGAHTVHQKLTELADRFLAPGAERDFSRLKAETMLLLREVEGSILFTPKMQRIIPMITYNMSRFSDNPDYLQDTAEAMMKLLNSPEEKSRFLQGLKDFLQQAPLRRAMGSGYQYELERPGSKVMDALARLVRQEANSEELTLSNSEKLEKIIHSLLSSPSNFTPLLHYVVPVDDGELRSFAELWIDTSEQQESGKKEDEGGGGIHVLIAFDVEAIGQFEAELMVHGNKVGLNLFCPPNYLEQFLPLRDYAAKLTAGTSYSLGEIYVGSLERPRSLIEVFHKLSQKRTGIDVKA